MAMQTGRTDFRVLICDCEGTSPINQSSIEKAAGLKPEFCGTQLCRQQLGEVQSRLRNDSPLLIGCTQEAPLFLETAGDDKFGGDLRFVNIREKAGWSRDGTAAGAKMGALIAEAMLDVPGPHAVPVQSGGVVMVLGASDPALGAARRLGQRMDVTLLLESGASVSAPHTADVPIFCGTGVRAQGHLGAFKVEIEGFAAMTPSARREIAFEAAAAGTTRSDCDIILDLRGGTPVFNAPDKRDGYFNPDPGDPAAVANALFDIVELVGEFEKPRYVEYDETICAHGRNGIVGCTRCQDICPAGAITPDGDKVAIDPQICAGCGGCAGVCPTGAVSYAMPRNDALLQRMRTLLQSFAAGGGKHPVLLFHDGDFGDEMIATMARYYDGLPANMLPVAVNALGQCSLDILLAARVYGAGKSLLLASSRDAEELVGLEEAISLSNEIVAALGYHDGQVELILEADPEAANARLWAAVRDVAVGPKTAAFEPTAEKRTALNLALTALHRVAPEPRDEIPLPKGAPFGTVEIDVDGCTLCLACTNACPTKALRDTPDYPRLSFVETACVQCGLCASTCPEKVIKLRPRLLFTGAVRNTRVIKEEEPFDCIRCGTPFATKSMIETVTEKMTAHSMFPNSQALRRLQMCADCRIIDMAETDTDPMAAGNRPIPRTTDDYLSGRITDDPEDDGNQ
ncbi:MAG: 4Fe-4S dicluster domain-containing protein [Rhodospirillaceae bacterium]|nr:4Fe-4S dicluster domain-containing protein [Rhodospirillaceae bacterium]MBT5192611.1 4Fe-4S dicluster domain-containing protein [Rhodospirillaceae bacterium]MBT5894292.1 4Fe-4S dicluster domain-containing protein [Rhodospirillaceae bacterium]MBT6430363.1 4Fe-4S dicluster domain-containing protein [Rhodospirillaceae bacterium]MBT7759521.1 4Fe-4S dicluster domain-containing protein [Rhodospirillaceae bacterium]